VSSALAGLRPDGQQPQAHEHRESDLRVTIQALGWRTEKKDRRYLPLQDDIASVAFWYQTLPSVPFEPLPGPDQLEII
jgi:hypothetical protein